MKQIKNAKGTKRVLYTWKIKIALGNITFYYVSNKVTNTAGKLKSSMVIRAFLHHFLIDVE